MRWVDLSFLHWRVESAAIAALLPAQLALDTFDGAAWLGIVPFSMEDASARLTPRVRRLADFAELNVRTYVTAEGKPGVWFFSLDATQPLAVRVARRAFNLPYFDARISTRREGDGHRYESVRAHRGAPPAELVVRWNATGPPRRSVPGTLEHFLTERYCLYAVDGRGRLRRQEVDHTPWPLQPASAEVERCTMTAMLGIALDGPPLAHAADLLDVVAWLPQRVG